MKHSIQTTFPIPSGWMDLLPESMPMDERIQLRDAIENGSVTRGVRLHKLSKDSFLSWIGEVQPNLPPLSPVPWSLDGFFVDPNLSLGKHPLHAAGAYYLQEPSAMVPVAALDVQHNHRVLDLCAAPGGKSSQIAALLSPNGFILANEPILTRARELRANLTRLGVTNAMITQESAERLAERFGGYFDRILVDAPCSGEGMFRRSMEARRDWSARVVEGCAARQLSLLDTAQSMLKAGGVMVYSTCTFNHIENDAVVHAFLKEHPWFELEKLSLPGLPSAINGMIRIMPHSGHGEGQFAARLRKTNSYNATSTIRKINKKNPQRHDPSVAPAAELSAFDIFRKSNLPGFNLPERIRRLGGHLTALPLSCPDPERWSDLRILAAGIDLGEARPYGWAPSHALAMAINPGQVRRAVALGDKAAVAWLAGNDIELPIELSGDMSSGYAVTDYRGMPLGFGKVVDGWLKNKLPFTLRAEL